MSTAAKTEGTGGHATAAPGQLRHNSGFRRLWIGQVLSQTGTNVALIAYPLLILALTGSPAIAGAVGTVRLLIQLVLGLPGGALSDRLDRRLTMMVCDSARAAVLGLLCALVLLHVVTWPIVLAAAVIDGALNVLFDPSATAALPGIVANEQLEEAWAATEARSYAANLAGPAIGGFLFGLGRAIPFLADALSYLASVGTVSRIRGSFGPQSVGERKALWREAADGIRVVWQHRLLRAVVIQAPLMNFAFTGVLYTITLALRRARNGTGHHRACSGWDSCRRAGRRAHRAEAPGQVQALAPRRRANCDGDGAVRGGCPYCPVGAGRGSGGRHVPAGADGERRAVRRDAAGRAAGHARPGHQHPHPGSHGPGSHRSAHRRAAPRELLWPVGHRRLRCSHRGGGRHVRSDARTPERGGGNGRVQQSG